MEEQATLFARTYGVQVRQMPIFVSEREAPSPKESEAEPRRRSPTPWRARPSERQALASGRSVVDGRIADLIRHISERTLPGDLYVTDSPRQAEMLYEGAAVAKEYPFCVLTLTLLVAKENPLQIDSVKGLLNAGRRLGIMDPSLDGMGEAAFRLLLEYVRIAAEGRSDEKITPFDRHSKLLKALENGEIDAALVWEPLALKTAAGVVELPDSERLAIRQPLLALSVVDHQGCGKRFADFLISPKGREITKKYGFTASY